MQTVEYKRRAAHKLTEIKSLWEELNKIHLVDSVYFKEHYVTFSFDKRSALWLKLSEENFHLLVAETEDSTPVGYCVSTIDANQKGEIDSLFISPSFRQQGIGRALVEKSMEWLQRNQCKPIRLTVSYGHEGVACFLPAIGVLPSLNHIRIQNQK